MGCSGIRPRSAIRPVMIYWNSLKLLTRCKVEFGQVWLNLLAHSLRTEYLTDGSRFSCFVSMFFSRNISSTMERTSGGGEYGFWVRRYLGNVIVLFCFWIRVYHFLLSHTDSSTQSFLNCSFNIAGSPVHCSDSLPVRPDKLTNLSRYEDCGRYAG